MKCGQTAGRGGFLDLEGDLGSVLSVAGRIHYGNSRMQEWERLSSNIQHLGLVAFQLGLVLLL